MMTEQKKHMEHCSKALYKVGTQVVLKDGIPREALLMSMTELVVVGWQEMYGDGWEEDFIVLAGLINNKEERNNNARN